MPPLMICVVLLAALTPHSTAFAHSNARMGRMNEARAVRLLANRLHTSSSAAHASKVFADADTLTSRQSLFYKGEMCHGRPTTSVHNK